ncbi:putative reverse transcriptase domain-containing protein [Tanacetum coccineum]
MFGGEEQEEAFMILKNKLCNALILALPDGPEDFVVYCDALGLGLGCVLMRRGKANVVADALSRKERIKPKRVRSINMTIQSSIKDWILAAQNEASKVVNVQHNSCLGANANELDYWHRSDALWTRLEDEYGFTFPNILSKRSYYSKPWTPCFIACVWTSRKVRTFLFHCVGDHVLLKVSPWKGVVRFKKKGKLAPRFVGPFEITKKEQVPVPIELRFT